MSWVVEKKSGGEIQHDNAGWVVARKDERFGIKPTVGMNQTLVAGIGWAPRKRGGNIDIDIAALLLNKEGVMLSKGGMVDYQCMRGAHGAVYLSGDNRQGSESKNDNAEEIFIDLNGVPDEIYSIVVLAHIYEGGTFADVTSGHAHLFVKETKQSLLSFDISELTHRDKDGAFLFQIDFPGADEEEEGVEVYPITEPFKANNTGNAAKNSRYNNSQIEWYTSKPKPSLGEAMSSECILI